MFFYPEFWIVLAASALACAIGFKKYVWFISIGYGMSISAIGIALICIYPSQMTDIPKLISCIIFIAYGFRLGGYLLFRELKSSAYNNKMKTEISDGSNMTFFVKVMLWLSCALLYFLMTSPVIYRLGNGIKSDPVFIVGICIATFGIIFETASDYQKSKAKKINPKRFCDSGLFKIVRCPNYLGELIIWTGIFISGVTALNTVGQWICAVIGYLGIIYIMFSGARRLEIRQDKSYGEDPEYQKYIKSTPILLPLVPLYSVKKHKWLVG